MQLILAHHSSYPRIGDDPDLQLLRRTITERDQGAKTDSDVRAAEDRMTELALAEQLEAGLDWVTDGQVRWYDSISHLAGKLAGVHITGLLRFFDTNTYFRQPVVRSRIERTQPLVVDDFRFAKAKSTRPVKAVLTGPLTLARHSVEVDGAAGGFEKLVEGYAAALAAEIAALSQAGATLIQVDEPALAKNPGDLPLAEQALTSLAAAKGQSDLLLALYFGDAAPIYDQLQKLPVDALGLDFIYSPRLADIIAANGSSKRLALGLVDGRNTRLEEAGTIARQLEKMARRLAGADIFLTSACGFEYLPRDRARLKLKHFATIKAEFLGGRA